METNIVTKILEHFFGGSYSQMAKSFGVSQMAVRKWEISKEFPAKHGRMQQAHELTGIDYKILTPSAFKSPKDFEFRLQEYRKTA
ncbi:hypothetical protein ATY35_09580 [Vibrio cidicii]|uniref:Transcriptional regulator n=1 Tax=Vibrio cidicii TaxID=1763883 RepID=A0ABR5W5M7_9VIBR|nr:hypothetical protein [Vibrio cidicii]EJK2113532.1 hypothetical protein [Vibrio navarrensis]KYN90534.1 hypothetical protein ATY35_09580 [Vibrio cidicii]